MQIVTPVATAAIGEITHPCVVRTDAWETRYGALAQSIAEIASCVIGGAAFNGLIRSNAGAGILVIAFAGAMALAAIEGP